MKSIDGMFPSLWYSFHGINRKGFMRVVCSSPDLTDFDLEYPILSLVDKLGNIDDGSVNVDGMKLDIWLRIDAETANDGIEYAQPQHLHPRY